MIAPKRILTASRDFVVKNPRSATAVAGIGGLGIGWVGTNAKRDIEDAFQPRKKKSLSSLIIVLVIVSAIVYAMKR
ncbi:hypothetical protein Maeo_1237 [Methanococcus aeolicus Nankai-3]|uniref:Uncharacterized protein n=1 Tax=Methanococcus aeolicus (strain ATCC BAA-1280 / DSM 17508 / OCM 812 / Nankai-3) TaxID=419665 RepID=A6UWE1_META3|nr:hypothetical protein [Methanococcus aeolicus]ABR56813.1 hypothetical protein Maeo_1237 [Methanococcus aeolicus Nankai-3]